MKVREICRVLDEFAPPEFALDWDNVGLLVGAPDDDVRKMLFCIDLTEDVLDEAVATKAQMIFAYHPVIFKGIHRVTPSTSPAVYHAIRNGIAIYCGHTALDVARGGTNDVLAEMLGLTDCRPLEPMSAQHCKIVTFLPHDDLPNVTEAAFAAGAGHIGEYSRCSFFCHGVGTFHGGEGTNPTVGRPGRSEAVEEVRLEMTCTREQASAVCRAIRQAHSYEEPPIDVHGLLDTDGTVGLGRVGRLARPASLDALLRKVKKTCNVKKLLLAGGEDPQRTIGTVAVAAGSCGAMWKDAANAGAGLYVTGEMRHHDALAAVATGMVVACVGHSNSERPTLARLAERLTETLPDLKTVLSQKDRDPFTIT
jgi:dinuclear metal center YbgI/SA1388 family protein